jgi:hypothetical protein
LILTVPLALESRLVSLVGATRSSVPGTLPEPRAVSAFAPLLGDKLT